MNTDIKIVTNLIIKNIKEKLNMLLEVAKEEKNTKTRQIKINNIKHIMSLLKTYWIDWS